ncbi:MAG: Gfo/Idh/MocA family oxidoreductase [Leptospiraceae bacterium]|nr:Gfo/Idh/MocA family oxidoreductase [Leptospiraceae bacterium]
MKRKVALIGLGRIGWTLEKDPLRYHPCTHAGSLRSFEGLADVVAICDIDPRHIHAFQKWWPAQRQTFKDFAAMIQALDRGQLDIDMAVVATPQDVHTTQAIHLLKRNLKDVLIEKPPGENRQQAIRIQKAWQDSSSRLWINFERRYHPGYAKVKKLLHSQNLGGVRSVRGRVFSGASPIHPGSGPLLHDAVHWLDLLFWFFDLPDSIKGIVQRDEKGLERSSHLLFQYRDFVATLETGARSQYFEFEMEIDFERGRIHCGNQGFRLWKTAASKRYSNFQELKEASFPFKPGKRNPWKEMYSRILKGKADDYQKETALQGLKTVHYIHQAYRL